MNDREAHTLSQRLVQLATTSRKEPFIKHSVWVSPLQIKTTQTFPPPSLQYSARRFAFGMGNPGSKHVQPSFEMPSTCANTTGNKGLFSTLHHIHCLFKSTDKALASASTVNPFLRHFTPKPSGLSTFEIFLKNNLDVHRSHSTPFGHGPQPCQPDYLLKPRANLHFPSLLHPVYPDCCTKLSDHLFCLP